MEPRPPLPLAESLAAALDWWREAGVDLAYLDEPQSWLRQDEEPSAAEGPPVPSTPAAPAPSRIGGDPAAWPGDLAAFREWWLSEPSLDPAPPRSRVPPRGSAGAPLAVVVPMPEAEDDETLLSGREGRLIAGMTRAMGLDPAEVYLASALPRHAPHSDWPALTAAGLGDILRHHLALAAPQRLLVLGRDVLPLLGHDPAQGAPALKEVAIQGRAVPLLASFAPGRLLDHARRRAELWRQWLDWTGLDWTGERDR